VLDHDFPDAQLGKVAPYGIYDVGANTGWVNVGTDNETAQFAVASIRRWWNAAGRDAYPRSARLLITADAGGANAANSRLWKRELAAFALETGLQITVCHLPPGTSKWNKIEHRLFSQITTNWRGRPLTSHEVVLESIRATTTRTGLSVQAHLDTETYPTGIEISDRELAALPVTGHDWHKDWNYTLRPEPYTVPESPYRRQGSDRPSPHTAAFCHPSVTGLSDQDFNTLISRLQPLQDQRRADAGERQRGGRPSTYPTRAARSLHTLPDMLLATILRHRHGLPVTAIATLLGTSGTTVYHYTDEVSALLKAVRHPIRTLRRKLTSLDDLSQLARTTGPNPHKEIKLAC